MENLDPPPPPPLNQGWENGAFLPFARLHPWFGGDGGLLFHFILSKIAILDKINGKPRPPLPPKSRMGKWRVFALRAPSSLIWGGDGGLLFHFILSKIVAFLAPDSWGPINGPFWSPISLLNVKVPPSLPYPVSFSFFLKCALLAWLCIFLPFRDFHVHSAMFCRMCRWLTFHQLKFTVMQGNQLKLIVSSSAKRTTGRCSERN